jgi:hypothetical protein
MTLQTVLDAIQKHGVQMVVDEETTPRYIWRG